MASNFLRHNVRIQNLNEVVWVFQVASDCHLSSAASTSLHRPRAPVKRICGEGSHVVGVRGRIVIAVHHVRSHCWLLGVGDRS